MYCQHCGATLPSSTRFCTRCGAAQEQQPHNAAYSGAPRLVGFSPKISDPAFARYIRHSNWWATIFAFVLAVAAIVGFFIYGESSSEMENPQALLIGVGVGAMFLVIAFSQILGRSRSKTWDGTVEDKRIREKTERKRDGDGGYRFVDYLEYVVVIRSDQGKRYAIVAREYDAQYNYYRIGDRVRYHAGLNSYEKYDKTGDTIIFCAACSSLNVIQDDVCFRCKCPLLK